VGALKAVCGMLEAALPWCKKFRHELEQQGFMFNPHNSRVANCEEKGSQHAILFHVDNMKSSHKNPKVNDDFEKWLQDNCVQHGKVANHRDCSSEKCQAAFGMIKHVENMINNFQEKLKSTDVAPC
jgi:hypothetical protein